MRSAAITIVILLSAFVSLRYAAPSVYQECTAPDGHFSIFQTAVYKLSGDTIFNALVYLLTSLLSAILFVWAYRNRKQRKLIRAIALVITGSLTLILFCLSILLFLIGTANGYGADASRNSFIGTARAHLELYYDTNGRYPTALLDSIPDSYKRSAVDPVTKAPYRYAVSPDRQSYVLSATFGVKNNSNCLEPVNSLRKLKDDLDGNVFGVDCNDPIYCVGYSMKDGEFVELK